jgi:hypothetical protein
MLHVFSTGIQIHGEDGHLPVFPTNNNIILELKANSAGSGDLCRVVIIPMDKV